MREFYGILLEVALDASDKLMIISAPLRKDGVAAIERLFVIADQPIAALFFNEAVAFGVCEWLHSTCIEPSIYFGVIGFDDVIGAKTAVPGV